MHGPVTLWELALAFGLIGLGILVGTVVTTRRMRVRTGLPFHPRCLR
ncbi:MAG TPA: hypothetical protein VLK79_12800 [Gaiellales bacterium]|nr:hypothetical protein [Gaiellales bacterium]